MIYHNELRGDIQKLFGGNGDDFEMFGHNMKWEIFLLEETGGLKSRNALGILLSSCRRRVEMGKNVSNDEWI